MQISQNNKYDKKYMLIGLALACVGILAIILVLVFSMVQSDGCEHIDENNDLICDLCGVIVGDNGELPDDTPSDDEKPVEEVPPVDYTTDVDNATLQILAFLNGETQQLMDNVSLSNVQFGGNLISGADLNTMPEEIEIDGDKMYYEYYNEEDVLIQTYVYNTEEGIFTVVYDGYTYEATWSPVDVRDPVELTSEDIIYNEATQYFEVRSEKMDAIRDALLSDMDLNLEMIDVGAILNDLTYTLKFKIDANNNLSELHFKGVSVMDDVTTDVLSLSYVYTDIKTTSSLVLNYYVLVKMDLVAIVGSDNTGNVTLNGYIKPPIGVEMENMDIVMTAKAKYKDTVIEFSEDVITAMQSAREEYIEPEVDLTEVLSKKYPDNFLCATNCDLIYVYDTEYQVYVYLNVWRSEKNSYFYGFSDYSKELDRNCCTGSVGNGMLYVINHHESENLYDIISLKYEGRYTSSSDCDAIIVYDVDYNVYVYFAQDFDDESTFYVFDSFAENIESLVVWGIPCTGHVDEKRLLVDEHDTWHALQIKYRTIVQEDILCDTFVVYDEEYHLYVIFERDIWSDHTFVIGNIDIEAPVACCEYRRPTVEDLTNGIIGFINVEHTHLCSVLQALKGKDMNVNGDANEMPIYVQDSESGYLLVFYPVTDSEYYKLAGYISFGTPNATLDLENLTLNMQ